MNFLKVAGEVLELDLQTKWAPNTCRALMKSGSIQLTMYQSQWCGPVMSGEIGDGPLLEIDTLEQPVISLYPGSVCIRPVDGRNSTYDPMVWAKSPEKYNQSVELLLSYGYGEFRNETGPSYVTPIAMIRDFNKDLAAKLRQFASTGPNLANFQFREL
jgi:hypothetical protein